MINKLDLVAISKNGRVYVKEKEEYSSRLSQYKLRFDVEEVESFHKDWKVFSSVPETVEEFIHGCETILKYKLKDGFTQTDKTPTNMTKEAFRCCDDECENSEIRGLYEPVYRQELDEWRIVDMKIELIDSDCEPLLKHKYPYTVQFPGYIDKHMIVRHKLPCFITGDRVFDYIRSAVKTQIPNHCQITSDYDFHFEVKIKVPHLNNPLNPERKSIIQISKKKYQYSGKVLDVHADNYAELEKKIDSIIQGYINKMKTEIYICPTCGGRGWVEKE
jgi:hypothetical protein